jgi:hypothetical protein
MREKEVQAMEGPKRAGWDAKRAVGGVAVMVFRLYSL